MPVNLHPQGVSAPDQAKLDHISVTTNVDLDAIDDDVAEHDASIVLLAAQASAIDTYIGRSSTSYGLVTGGTDNRATLVTLTTSTWQSGDVIRLPKGTFTVNGGGSSSNTITFTSGVRFIGHPEGTTFKFTSPSGSHSPFRLSSNVTLEDITFQWDMSSHPAAAADCSLVFGNGVDNVTMKRCKFFGDADTTAPWTNGSQLYFLGNVMPISLWNCTNVTMDDCEVARSTGTNYGLHVIGGSYHTYRNCYFHHCAADGVKVMGNSASGQPAHMRFIGCRSDYNGQTIIQGQTNYTATYTSSTTITPVNGGRYLVNFGSSGNFQLADTTEGDAILIAKLIGSAGTVTIKRADGTTIGTAMSSASDRWVAKFVMTSGTFAAHSTGATFTNGEGWDIVGNDIQLSDCIAVGNEGSGFQVKPSLVDAVSKNTSAGIRFSGCSAISSWAANGFGIVNNISSGEVSPQDITMTDCLAEDNRANGFVLTSGTLPIFSVTMNHCMSRNNYADGISIAAMARAFMANGCRCEGNGRNGAGWNVKLYAAKGVRFRDCYFSGVDPTSQALTTEGDNASTDVNKASNARCYGVLIDKSSGGTMADVVFDYCRWHNHLATNGAATDIRFYDSGLNPITTAYAQAITAVMGQNRLSFGNVMAGVITINSQQTATLTHSSSTAWSGATAYIIGDVAVSGGNLYRCILGHTNFVPPNATYWVQVGSDIVSFA